jgi:hypothetical protein
MRPKLLLYAVLLPFSLVAQEKTQTALHPHTFRVPPPEGKKDCLTLKQYYFVILVINNDSEKITGF